MVTRKISFRDSCSWFDKGDLASLVFLVTRKSFYWHGRVRVLGDTEDLVSWFVLGDTEELEDVRGTLEQCRVKNEQRASEER